MKIAFTIFLLLSTINISVFAQLKGKYCYGDGFNVECITFLENNRFEFYYRNCTDYGLGIGVYSLDKRNLTLQFQTDTIINTPIEFSMQKEVLNSDSNDSDSFLIVVNVLSIQNKEVLPLSSVIIKGNADKRIYGTITDLDGYGKFKVPKNLDSVTLTVESLGFETYTKSIYLNNDYQLTIYLPERLPNLINPSAKVKFKIKDIKNGEISLKRNHKKDKYLIYKQE